jgi:hypothetical protein
MATNPAPLTFFDTPERLSSAAVRQQYERAASHAAIRQVLHGVPLPAALLNRERQVVAVNDQFARDVGVAEGAALGRRLGELIGCVHAGDAPAGCGTAPSCVECGAAQAIYAAREQETRATGDCRILVTANAGGSLEFRVTVTPLPLGEDKFYLIVLRDTFNDNRRRALERLFFHDVLNAAGGLQGLLENWSDLSQEEAAELGPVVASSAATIVDEIQSYRDMVSAERGELTVQARAVDVPATCALLKEVFGRHAVAEGKTIECRVPAGTPTVCTDPVLLRRVLGNLLKNALEASEPGDTVTLTFGAHPRPWFEVHNASAMPESSQVKVFQRSFSTKAAHGRGLGTYGARLLVERYLEGRISFWSSGGTGTVFRVELPGSAAE